MSASETHQERAKGAGIAPSQARRHSNEPLHQDVRASCSINACSRGGCACCADLPKLFGSSEFTVRTLRFAWHIITVAWFGFAALLLRAGHGDLTTSGTLRIIGATAIVSGLLPLFITRGKHLSWVILFCIGGIAFWSAA